MKEIILENSLKEKRLDEAIEVADYEQIIGSLIIDKMKTSLAYKICEVQPLGGPVGNIFSINYDTAQDKFSVKKTKVEAKTSKIKSNITAEALEDMYATTKDYTLLSSFLRKASDKKENEDFINFLDTNAATVANITMPPNTADNAETILFHILEKVGEQVAEFNKDSQRTYTAFCILPAKFAAAPLAMSYTTSDEDESAMGNFRKTKFFLNPVSTDDNIYVGLCNPTEPGDSSIIFSPYQYFLGYATDPDSGQLVIHVFNRYNITLNPLKNMLVKFKIN